MKITKAQLREMVRQVVCQQLDEHLIVPRNSLKEQTAARHAAFEPDKRLPPGETEKAIASLKRQDKPKGKDETQKRRANVKKSLRGMHLEQEIDANASPLPLEVNEKLINIANAYMHGSAKMYSLQSIFEEVLNWVDDPMEAVNIIYNELNKVTTSDDAQVSEREKDKAQKAYDVLVDLAHQQRLYDTYRV